MKLSFTAAGSYVSNGSNASTVDEVIRTYQSLPSQASVLEKTRTEVPTAFGVVLYRPARCLPVLVLPVLESCLRCASSRRRHHLRYSGHRKEGELRRGEWWGYLLPVQSLAHLAHS